MPGHISNAADGSAGLYTTQHIAQQFTYTLDSTNGLVASSDYVAVLHFAGKPLASVLLVTVCGSIAGATVCNAKKIQSGDCDSLPACSMPFHCIQVPPQAWLSLYEQDCASQRLRGVRRLLVLMFASMGMPAAAPGTICTG